MIRCNVLLACALAACACAHAHRVEGLEERTREAPGGYVTGVVSGLERRAILDRRDFIYTMEIAPRSDRAAFTHLFGRSLSLAVWSIPTGTTPVPKAADFDVPINEYVFDVEAIVFSPSGEQVVTASRDRMVRAFSLPDGKPAGQFFAEDPLVSIAFVREDVLAIGSAKGIVTLLSWPEVRFLSEARVHTDEVRGLASLGGSRIASGGWDKSIVVLEAQPGRLDMGKVRLSFDLLPPPLKSPVVRAALDGWSGVFTYDATAPHVLVTGELARHAGIEPSVLPDTVNLNGQTLPVARGRSIQLKHLTVENVDVVVCDNCLPSGVHGQLGKPLLERFEMDANAVMRELFLTARAPPDPGNQPQTTVLREVRRINFDGFVNDVTADRAGQKLGVALSAEKAERNRKVYEREKRGQSPPVSETDSCAIVSVESGEIVRRWRRHVGVVSTAGISPDGKALASGGWDNWLYLFRDDQPHREVDSEKFSWIVRRVRFSPDGRLIAAAAWTPQNAVGNQLSDPSAVLFEVLYSSASIARSE